MSVTVDGTTSSSKVTPHHLRRDAYLYVRQSTLRQVVENTESTERQYALRQRAVALGWPTERVIVIDSDLGQSGASATDREGFQRLVAEVGMGRAGIVLGLEVSRLARNSADWHRLLEICAMTETLLLDEDGVYDPAHFNDRLVLGLKGTMSEAELHLLRARLRGGLLNKARRGDLRTTIPVGFVFDPAGRVVLDPDAQVQATLRLFFETFQRVGSCFSTVRAFRAQQIPFPRRVRSGPAQGELQWRPLTYTTALCVLHNPRFAGAFAYGGAHTRTLRESRAAAPARGDTRWAILHRDAHAGYLSWDEFEQNQRRLRECSAAFRRDHPRGPAREGPALLQGIVVCGRCGRAMTVRYFGRDGARHPTYLCQRAGIDRAEQICQSIGGRGLDAAIGALLLETVSPLAVEAAIGVQRELHTRAEDADRVRRQHVDRCRYEAEVARRRFVQVDPDHRLVADALELEWNDKLRAQQAAEKAYETARASDQATLSQVDHARVLTLATRFAQIWHDPKTLDRDRKRMARLVLEDVTITKLDRVTAHVRFRGGATTTLSLPRPQTYFDEIRTPPALVAEIDALLAEHTDAQVAAILAAKGRHPGRGGDFDVTNVAFVRKTYRLPSLRDRLRASGMLTLDELATRFHVTHSAIKRWRKRGLVVGRVVNDKDEYLYEDPGDDPRVRKAAEHAARIRPVAPGSRGCCVRGAV